MGRNVHPFRPNPVAFGLWLLVGIFLGYLGVILWHARTAEMDKVRQRAQSLSRLVAEHAAASFDRANLLLLDAATYLRTDDLSGHPTSERRLALAGNFSDLQRRFPGLLVVAAADAEGRIYASSHPEVVNRRIDDRHYFQVLKAEHRNGPAVSEAVKGRVSDTWGIVVARRLETHGGGFAGVLIASLSLKENFEDFYESVGEEQGMLITLRDTENRILVRYPVVENRINTVVSGSTSARQLLTGGEENVSVSVSPIDGVERVIALRRLRAYLVYAGVGLGTEWALAIWREQRNVALLVAAGIVIAAWFSGEAIRRRDRATAELFRTNDELTAVQQDLERANDRLARALALAEQNASHDELTGLWNRRMLNRRLEEALARSRRQGQPFSLVMFDLDHFKQINDKYGHLVGDQVLQEFARIVAGRIRENDFLSRWGGEEFVLILESTSALQAQAMAESLREEIVRHHFPQVGSLTVSMGIAECDPESDGQELLRRADESLYFAKLEGRNRVRVFCPED